MYKRLIQVLATILSLILLAGIVSSCKEPSYSAEDFYRAQIKAIAPDGSKIIFSGARDRFLMYESYLVGAEASDFLRLPLPEKYEDLSLSRGGKAILYRVDQTIFVMSPDDVSVMAIYENAFLGRSAPCFSPDGETVYFLGEESRLYRRPISSTYKWMITSFEVVRFYVVGDGSRIILHKREDRKSELMVMNADGTDLKKITEMENPYEFSFSPDGNSMLMYSIEGKELYYIDVAQNIVTPLPFDYARLSDEPFQFTPDGDRILICAGFGEELLHVYSMKTDGTDRQKIIDRVIWDYHVSLPDERIVNIGYINNKTELCSTNIDGTDDIILSLTDSGYYEEAKISFSADGSRIFFNPMVGDMITIRFDTSQSRSITKYADPAIDENNPPPGFTRGTDNCVRD